VRLKERAKRGVYISGDDGKWGKLSKPSSKKGRKKVFWLQT
jgi:hypothetical protein